MDPSQQHRRDVTGNEFGDRATINQGDVHYHLPTQLPPARPIAPVIPYPRNPDVVRRPDLVDKLDALLSADHGYRCAALWGLGGKTQIALEYAYRRVAPQPSEDSNACSVFWVHADSAATYAHDYKTIAVKLGIDKRLEGVDLFEAVREAIEDRPSWVLVLDNADDLALFGVGEPTGEAKSLEQYLPQGGNGTVLWTSRDRRIVDVVGPSQAIEVTRMTTAEATRLLATTRNDTTIEEAESGDAKDLLEELQWLPLAISQAGAYMRRTSTSVGQYLSLLWHEQHRWGVLEASQFDRHRRRGLPHSVLRTWSISVDRIRQQNEAAHRILHVIAFIDNQNIPFEMIAAASGYRERCIIKIKEAVARLMEFSFLSLHQTGDGEPSYDMHKLVQEASRYGIGVPKNSLGRDDEDGRLREQGIQSGAYFASIAMDVVLELFPRPTRETWGKCEKYLAHAIRVGEWAHVSGRKIETADLLSCVSFFLFERGRWREKEGVDAKALALRREVLGDRHPDTIGSMASLAATYHEQGRYSKAEKFRVEILALRGEVLGDRHLDTIRSMASLAATYYAQGRFAEANIILVEVLALRHTDLGDRHPDTIRSMADLAATYHAQGRYDEAEKIKVEALALRREILGDRHPDTIRSMADLAATYYAQGRYDEAEKIKVEALALRREILGDRHPDTIRSIANLAATYHAQGRYDEAEKIKVEALALRREVLGDRHPDTIRSIADLAATYHEQGRYDEAEKIKVEALALRREVLGEKHPDTIRSLASLAVTYHARGRYDEAEKIKVEALALRREVLGEKHPDTISSIANLAVTYHARGRYDKAEKIKVEALALRREVLGEKHPDTIRSLASLATVYHAQRRYLEAETIYTKALNLRREVLGEKHPDTITSMASLATVYHAQRRYHEAETIYTKALNLQREVLGQRHPDILFSMAEVGVTYFAQRRYDEAEKTYVEVLALRRDILGDNHPDTLHTMYGLAMTWYALDRSEEARSLMHQCYCLQRRALGAAHPAVVRTGNCLEEWGCMRLSDQETIQE